MRWSDNNTVIDGLRSKVLGPYEAIPLAVKDGDDAQLEAGTYRRTKSFNHGRSPTGSKFLNLLLSVLNRAWLVLRPSFFSGSNKSKKPLPLTAWLDGIRGLASLFVANGHGRYILFPLYKDGGWSSQHPQFFLLPIIRIIHFGTPMVTLFFIISGYVLSYRMLQLIRSKEQTKVLQSLASSVFRRGFRLYIPVAAIALGKLLVKHFNLTYPPSNQNPNASTISSILSQWFEAMVTAINPCANDLPFSLPLLKIDLIFWAVPVSYRGSLVIYGLLLALSRTERKVCLGSLIVCSLWLAYIGQGDIFLFIAGMVCAGLRTLTSFAHPTTAAANNTAPMRINAVSSLGKRNTRRRRILLKWVLPILALQPILYVLTQPAGWLQPPDWKGWGNAPFYPTLNVWTPRKWQGVDEHFRFWRCMSAVAFILLVDFSAILRRFFELSIPQYLGKISFSLYLLHTTFQTTIGSRLVHYVYERTGFIGIWWIRDPLSVVLCLSIYYFTLFWAADLATKYLDRGSVDIVRWIESKFIGEQQKSRPANMHGDKRPAES